MARYGGRVSQTDLRVAYERAGVTLKGQMQPNFVVLTEKRVRMGGSPPHGRGGPGCPLMTDGSKRQLERGNEAKKQAGTRTKGRGGLGRGTPGRK